ncbi:MAG: 4-hydroxy-tetrahydrodipicolinate reductase [Christensenellales bacterium]|jgi:4-hydroxy-tetrahydrodipicolinate reductase
MRVLIYGISGKMGKVLYNCLKESNEAEATCGVSKYLNPLEFDIPTYYECKEVDVDVDVIIDFSVTQALSDYLPYAVAKKIPCVIATTGYSEEERERIKKAGEQIAVFNTGNMSLGISVLLKLARETAKALEGKADIEIIEHHHNQKVDAPSGTALMLADGIKKELPNSKYVYGREGYCGQRSKEEIGIHALRGGSVVGKHEVIFYLNKEVITLKHEAESKEIFAQGAIKAAQFIVRQSPGVYSMEDLLAQI